MSMTWERRMSVAAARRAAAGPAEPVDACEIGDADMPEGHRGHHMHVTGVNGVDCSCGDPRLSGCFSVAFTDGREDLDAMIAARRCSLCGAEGVTALADFGR